MQPANARNDVFTIPPAAAGKHLIALDVDGTILDHDFTDPHEDPGAGHIPADAAQGIRDLHAAGHEVVIATGRSADAVFPILRRLGVQPEWCVAVNGAITLRRDPLASNGYRTEMVEILTRASCCAGCGHSSQPSILRWNWHPAAFCTPHLFRLALCQAAKTGNF